MRHIRMGERIYTNRSGFAECETERGFGAKIVRSDNSVAYRRDSF